MQEKADREAQEVVEAVKARAQALGFKPDTTRGAGLRRTSDPTGTWLVRGNLRLVIGAEVGVDLFAFVEDAERGRTGTKAIEHGILDWSARFEGMPAELVCKMLFQAVGA